jgi:hypothetical protein
MKESRASGEVPVRVRLTDDVEDEEPGMDVEDEEPGMNFCIVLRPSLSILNSYYSADFCTSTLAFLCIVHRKLDKMRGL